MLLRKIGSAGRAQCTRAAGSIHGSRHNLHSLSPSACIHSPRSEASNRQSHKVDSRRMAMLSKISPVELVLRASCNRAIRRRRVDGIFSRVDGDGRMDMRFGAAKSASCEAHERCGPRRAQSGGAAAIPRAAIAHDVASRNGLDRAETSPLAADSYFCSCTWIDPLCQSSRLPGGPGTPDGGQNMSMSMCVRCERWARLR